MLKTPALFGIWRPCLIVPAEMLRGLDRRELRLIFLHELIHLKNGDIAANWLMILVSLCIGLIQESGLFATACGPTRKWLVMLR